MSTPDHALHLGGEPTTSARFLFEVDGIEIGIFASVRGLEVTAKVEEIQEGGQNGFVHKLPGGFSWPNVVFSRGMTQADALFEWMNKTSGEGYAAGENKLVRHTGAITLIGAGGERLRSYSLAEVFPVRWKGPDFDVASENPLTEELEIAHHGFRSSTIPPAPPLPPSPGKPAAAKPPAAPAKKWPTVAAPNNPYRGTG